MAKFTLDDIRKAAEAKYGSTDIDVDGTTVVLVNALRLSKEKRVELGEVQKRIDEAGPEEDVQELLVAALRVVAQTSDQADVLVAAIGDDLATMAEVFSSYSEASQLGEASASAS